MKLITVTSALSVLSVCAGVDAQERSSVAPKNMQAIAPALANYTDNVLFGDVWVRPDLTPRDRSLVTVTALIATGKTAQLTSHLNRALANGVKPSEIVGVVTHLAFYSGWPNAVSALNVVEQVFKEREIDLAELRRELDATQPAAVSKQRLTTEPDIATAAPKLAQLTQDVILENLWRRAELSPRDRSLVTIAALAANGDNDQLASHVRLGMQNMLTRAQISEALTHLAFYAGLPRATAAAVIAGTVFENKTDNSSLSGDKLTVVEPGQETRTGPPSNFTGSVTVTSPFTGTDSSRLGGATVTFQPGARTNWHTHPLGQLLVITHGEGWVQAEGSSVRAVKAGDVIWTGPGVKHWHGAVPSSAMTHVAVAEALQGTTVQWLEPVSDDDYRGPLGQR